MNSDTKAIEIMAENLIKIVKMETANLPYDKTLIGIIKNVLPDNKYTLSINGFEYDIQSETTYNVGQRVPVLIPNNDYSNISISNVYGGGVPCEAISNIELEAMLK